MTTESLAAMARTSAHETTPGQAVSTLDFISSTTSNPLTEFAFGAAFFSPMKEDVSSRSTEPSHPCHESSRKPHEESTIHVSFKNGKRKSGICRAHAKQAYFVKSFKTCSMAL